MEIHASLQFVQEQHFRFDFQFKFGANWWKLDLVVKHSKEAVSILSRRLALTLVSLQQYVISTGACLSLLN